MITRFAHLRMLACIWKALRNIIAKSPPSLPEEEAKASIIDKINEFINTRITLAAKEIAKNAITKIRDGDVILTYGRFGILVLKNFRLFISRHDRDHGVVAECGRVKGNKL